MKAADIPAAVFAEPDYVVKSEIAFQRSIEGRATRYGLKVYHTEDPRRSRKGFPDLILAGPGGIVYRELKIPPRTTTVEQEQWLALLRQIGQDAAVWIPADMQSGEIEHTLRRLCRPLLLSTEEQLSVEVRKLTTDAALADAAARVVLGERDNARALLDAARSEITRLETKIEDRRVRLVNVEADVLNIRGVLSDRGDVAIDETVLPAVVHVLDQRDEAREALERVRAVADEIAGGPHMRSLIADQIRTAIGGDHRG